MKTFNVCIILAALIITAVPVFAQEDVDYGIPLVGDRLEGNKRGACWSPDGKWIAVNLRPDIYLFAVDGEDIINITGDIDWGGDDYSFSSTSFSPDGTKLTSTLSIKGQNKVVSIDITTKEYEVVMEDAREGVWSSDGKYLAYYSYSEGKKNSLNMYDTIENKVTVIKDEFETDGPFPMCFTPDGLHILAPLMVQGEMDLYLIPVDGGEPELLEIDEYPGLPGARFYPKYSPDGKWLAYTKIPFRAGNAPEYYICIYNTETGIAKNLFPRGYMNLFPNWSPDSKKICYTQKPDEDAQTSEIYILEPDLENLEASPRGPDPLAGERPEDLAYAQVPPEYGTRLDIFNEYTGEFGRYFDTYKINPRFSPDGKWIAFYTLGPGEISIFLAPARGGEAVLIYYEYNYIQDEYFANIEDLCFTPDGNEITFQRDVCDVNRGGFVEIVGDFSVNRNIIPDIESVNIYTGEHRVLVRGGFHPCWSRDGRYLTYINFDERIWTDELQTEHNGVPAIYDKETGETRYLSDDVIKDKSELDIGYASGSHYYYNKFSQPTFSPDGSHIVLSIMVWGNAQLYRIPFEGGKPEQLTFLENKHEYESPNRCMDIEYSPDGQWIIFQRMENDHSVIYNTTSNEIFDVITGEKYNDPIDIREIEAVLGGISSMSWSPDGDRLCYNLSLLDDNRLDISVNLAYAIYILDFYPDNYGKAVIVEASEQPGFALLRNYPNPFNLSTTIEFTVPETGFAELVIYNMAGQKVRELMSEYMIPGIHSVVWDGCDENGTPVSSGVYISRLRTGDNVFSNRMMLVK